MLFKHAEASIEAEVMKSIPEDLQDDSLARLAIDEKGKLIYANDAFYTLAGHDVKDKKPFLANDLIKFENAASHKEIAEGVHNVIINGSGTPRPFHCDWVKPGFGRSYLVASQIQGDGDAPSGSADMQHDLEELFSISGDLMIVMEATGRILRCNNSFKKIFGQDYSRDFVSLFDGDNRVLVRGMMMNLTGQDDGIQSINFETKLADAAGELCWIEWQLNLKDTQIYCIGRDMTASKLHQVHLERQESQLKEAENIGRMGHWRWVIGQDGIQWSDQIYTMFGLDAETYTPQLNDLNRMVHRRDVGRVIQAFQRAIIEEKDYDMEFRILREDGDIRHIQCEGRCERDEDGDVIALYGIMQDVTERVLYEQDLKEAKDAAERAYAAKSQFLANMSHELRTPLNAVIGFSEIMQQQLLGPIGTDKYLDYVGGIRESGEHLLDLISDILDMSKIEAGKYELVLEEIEMTKVMKLAVHMMEGRALEADVKIIAEDLQNEERTIVADRRGFMQIMLNILSNAVKFSKEGGEVMVSSRDRSGEVEIKVVDEGIGIPANKLNTILRPFEQACASYNRDHEGSGLGLAITKELVELHGGSLQIDSKVGIGTVVTVRLPFNAYEAMQRV